MSIRLAACICFFQEGKSLKRCIDSIIDGVDVVICVDGRFPDYDFPFDLSIDESREIVLSYSKAVLIDYHAPEVEKRNRYLRACAALDCKYALMIDADEFVMPGADWNTFRQNCETLCDSNNSIYGVRFEYNPKAHHDSTPYPRLWYRPYDLMYFEKHNVFKHKTSAQTWTSGMAAAYSPLIEGIRMTGDDSLRDPEHVKRVYDYQVKLIEKENRK